MQQELQLRSCRGPVAVMARGPASGLWKVPPRWSLWSAGGAVPSRAGHLPACAPEEEGCPGEDSRGLWAVGRRGPCADQQTQGPGSHRRHPRSAARVWDGLPGRPEGRTGPARGRLTGGCALSLCALLRGAGARRATAPCLCKSRRARRLLERSASFGNSPLGQREERFGDSENAMTSALPRARLCR